MQAFLEENVPQNTQNGVIFKTWNWNLAIFFIQICHQLFFSASYMYYWYISHNGLIWASVYGRHKKVKGRGEGEKREREGSIWACASQVLDIFNVVVTSRGKEHYGTTGEFTASLRISFSFSY